MFQGRKSRAGRVGDKSPSDNPSPLSRGDITSKATSSEIPLRAQFPATSGASSQKPRINSKTAPVGSPTPPLHSGRETCGLASTLARKAHFEHVFLQEKLTDYAFSEVPKDTLRDIRETPRKASERCLRHSPPCHRHHHPRRFQVHPEGSARR